MWLTVSDSFFLSFNNQKQIKTLQDYGQEKCDLFVKLTCLLEMSLLFSGPDKVVRLSSALPTNLSRWGGHEPPKDALLQLKSFLLQSLQQTGRAGFRCKGTQTLVISM